MSRQYEQGRVPRGGDEHLKAQAALQSQAAASGQEGAQRDKGVQIDGFQQVLEMLRVADPAFRESLLKRIASRDLELARTLRADLTARERG
jgi:hypothetical protein